MNTRTFKIPLTMAAAGLSGCGGFDFEGNWDVRNISLTYANDPGYIYSTDYPQVYEDETETWTLQVDPAAVNLVQLYEYSDGTSYTYNLGPFSWFESEKKRFEITGAVDFDRFVCDADPDDNDKLGCDIVIDLGTDAESTARLSLDRVIP